MHGLLIGLGIAVAIWLLAIGALLAFGRVGAARELAGLIPNLLLLFKDLVKDDRVPRSAKLWLGFAAEPTGSRCAFSDARWLRQARLASWPASHPQSNRESRGSAHRSASSPFHSRQGPLQEYSGLWEVLLWACCLHPTL